VPDLALPDQLAQRADRVLDRRGGVDAVLVVEVDVVGAKAPQRPLDGDAEVLRGAVDLLRAPWRWEMTPNLVARTTWSRRSAMARPTSSWLV
jgi:hypothetical protein